MSSLERARSVQRAMLPKTPVLPGLEIGVIYEPCDEVGGDFYDFIPIGSDQLGIVVADVSGHGVEAALMMAAAKKALHIHGRGRVSPRETLVKAARELADDLPASSFLTCFYGVLHLRSMELRFASAGHNPPIHCTGRSVATLPSRGVVINRVLTNSIAERLEERVVKLSLRDRLLLHTDGVTEYANHDGEQFGDDRLLSILGQRKDETAEDMLARIRGAVEIFADDVPPDDDITMLALRVAEPTTIVVDTDPKKPSPQTNLELPVTQFFGRVRELEEITGAVESGRRTIAVHGAAGVGKSRLLSETARSLASQFSGGAYRIDATDMTRISELEAQVARTLRIPVIGENSISDAIGATFHGSRKTLLIIDAYDGLINQAEEAIEDWQAKAPELHLWVSSRALPFLSNQLALKLDGLNVEPSEDAYRLFCDRAGLDCGFAEPGNDDAIAHICQLLEGNPLALETAASRARKKSAHDVLDFLRTTLVGAPALDTETRPTAIDFAMQGRPEWESQCLAALGLFRGDFPADAATRVLEKLPELTVAPEEVLNRLSEGCLLTNSNSAFGIRYRLANMAKLETPPGPRKLDQCERAFALSYAVSARKRAAQLCSNRALEGAEWFKLEEQNLPAALEAALGTKQMTAAVDITTAMLRWSEFNNAPGLLNALQAVLAEQRDHKELKALRKMIAARLHGARGMWSRAFKDMASALRETAAGSVIHARALLLRGRLYSDAGRHGGAQRHLMASSKAFHALGDRQGRADALLAQALDAHRRNEFGESLRYAERAIDLTRGATMSANAPRAFGMRARALCGLGRFQEALRLLRRLRESLDGPLPPMRRAEALYLEGETRLGLNQGDKARKCFVAASAADLKDGGSWIRIRSLFGLVKCEVESRKWADAIGYASDAIDYARKRKTASMLAEALLTQGQLMYRRGDFAAALQRFEQSAGTLGKRDIRQEEDRTSACLALGYQAICLAKTRQYREARNRAEFAERKLTLRGKRSIEVSLLCQCARALAVKGAGDAREGANLANSARSFARKHELAATPHAPTHLKDAWTLLADLGAY